MIILIILKIFILMSSASTDQIYASYVQKLSTIESNYSKLIKKIQSHNRQQCKEDLDYLIENGKFKFIPENLLYTIYIPNFNSNILDDFMALFTTTKKQTNIEAERFSKCNKNTEINNLTSIYIDFQRNLSNSDNLFMNCLNNCMVKDSLSENLDKEKSLNCLNGCYSSVMESKKKILEKYKNSFI